MNDEYGRHGEAARVHVFSSITFESKVTVEHVPIAYHTYGVLNEDKSNAVVVCHALTGSSDAASWWADIIGPGKVIDTTRFFVVCCNVFGSCYGSFGPTTLRPDKRLFGSSFPHITIRDCVNAQWRLLQEVFGISQVFCVIGGSLGGMQALEWLLLPHVVKIGIVVACGPQHTAWQIAFGEAQRQAIYADPKWRGGDCDMNDLPKQGLSIARMIAMISYRSHDAYIEKFGREVQGHANPAIVPRYEVEDYLHYQGEKILTRFDAMSYVALTRVMNTHDIQRGRGSVEEVLNSIYQPVFVVGIDSDVLYPLSEQQLMHKFIRKSLFGVIHSKAGHDGFLLESKQLAAFIDPFLREHETDITTWSKL